MFTSLNPDDRIVTCSIARGEILFGLEKLPEGQRRALLRSKAEGVIFSLPCEAVPPEGADRYATLKVSQ